MNIRVLIDGRLRVELKNAELTKYGLDRSSVGSAGADSGRLIREILDKARSAGFCARGRLLMEVFPRRADGCVIYFTALPATPSRPAPPDDPDVSGDELSALHHAGYILDCPCLEDMISAACRFSLCTDIPLRSSALYCLGGEYSLVFRPLRPCPNVAKLDMLLAGLGEYGALRVCSPAAEAVLSEHGSLIISERAVERLMRYFS